MGLKRFDFKIKENNKKKSIIVASIIVLVLLVGVTIYATYAAYKDTKTYNIIQGRVTNFVNADLAVSIKLVDTLGNETIASDIPSYLEFEYDSSKSACDGDSTITFNESDYSATISSSGKDKCTLYFKKRSDNTLKDAILANSTLVTTTPDFSVAATDENTNIYQATDDLGTSYYFRGATTNNYVKFGKWAQTTNIDNYYDYGFSSDSVTISENADMYWRILRINGDETIRLVYAGISLNGNGTKYVASIGDSRYNPTSIMETEQSVQYVYDNNGILTDSSVKEVVDTWYTNNLEHKYGKYIADGTFCNDTEITSTSTYGYPFYATYNRLVTNKLPQLTCKDTYKLTVENGKLSEPIGLITADEVSMAGGVNLTANNSYYLNNGYSYWTMSPHSMEEDSYDLENIYALGTVFDFVEDGSINSRWTDGGGNVPNNVRPVINLDANIKLYGTGTISDPYRLTEEL